MFVNIMEFPPIREGRDRNFRDWFVASDEVYARFPGFVSRRLLEARARRGGYVAIIEHESEETFMRMHHSPERDQAWAKVLPLFVGKPKPRFYEVVSG